MNYVFFLMALCGQCIWTSESISQETLAADVKSNITSIQSFNEIREELDQVNPDTLVILDVDDTLITSKDMVLRPCGATFRPASWKDVDPKKIPYLISIMLNESQAILTESSIPQLIKNLESKGVKTIALTAARTGKFGVIESMEDWRLLILRQHDIDFSISFPETEIIYFDERTQKESDYSLFKEGILFLGDENKTKGELLLEFLEKVQWKPKMVIFIDDKVSQLSSVESSLRKAKIPFQGYQYQGVDKLPGEFNEQTAETQFDYLRKNNKWLSDSEAKKEMRK